MLAFTLSRPVYDKGHANKFITINYEVEAESQREAIKTILDLYEDEEEWLGYSIDQMLYIAYSGKYVESHVEYKGLGSHKQLNTELSRTGITHFHEIRVMMRNCIAQKLIQAMKDDLEDDDLWS